MARAIAESIGPGTRVGSTQEITPDVAASATLLVVGAPVHAMTLPTVRSLDSVGAHPIGPGEVPAEVGHPLMRDWVAELPYSDAPAAAFDTRISGLVGRGGVSALERLLKARGRRLIDRGAGFVVINRREIHQTASLLREGELARASAWGARLATLR
ncbi:hypothetical protein [Demequina lutea]|uniref:Uncharacterized protein n=1 Tax=Demequina lutea TaxID=431489 RepID=A0A7Y9ZCQ2_9MICO|nr:hypothetical protein [Demequina lutea]NYI40916.1 hypothetical protein [Demequina lutea]